MTTPRAIRIPDDVWQAALAKAAERTIKYWAWGEQA